MNILKPVLSCFILLVCHAATMDAASVELAPGEYQPAANLDAWVQRSSGGTISVDTNSGRPSLLLESADPKALVSVSARLPEDALGKAYEITVFTRNTTTGAQLMVTEGFVWGREKGKDHRFFRSRGSADGELNELRVRFEVKALPVHVAVGIFQGTGRMFVDDIVIREISPSEVAASSAASGVYIDLSRREALIAGLKRYTDVAAANAKKPELPAPLREYLRGTAAEATKAARGLGEDKESLDAADRVLSRLERIVLLRDGAINPERVALSSGESPKAVLTLFNLFADTSVWARLEASSPAVAYRQSVGDSGIVFGLNNADLINLPPREPVHLEVSGAVAGDSLIVYPLDHYSSDVRLSVTFDASAGGAEQ